MPRRSLQQADAPADSRALLELEHCSLVLGGERVLDEVSFRLRRGERWALVGPNGSGKTLLLKMLRGDVWPTPMGRERRRYCLGGAASEEPAGSKQSIAYVGPERQDKYIRYDWNLTVEQVVTTGLFDEDIPLSTPSSAQRAKVARVLQRFSLRGLRHRWILTLSYGQRRLALVARAFAGPARVLLLDEVFNGLDVRAKERLRRALEQPRGGHEWVLTSHRPHELPGSVTHIAVIEHGRIVSAGPAAGHRSDAPARRAAGRRLPALRTAAARARQAGALVSVGNATLYRDYRPVIRDLNWTVQRGEHWAVLGANGSGKSTLLGFLYGDQHAALGGTIERARHAPGTRIEMWKRRVGWVSPELQAEQYLEKSIEEIVISGRYASVGLDAPPTAADRRAARRWLDYFGIGHLGARGPRQVSYGQMRLALLARAMINDPELLLLDEPCTGLDRDVRANVLSEIDRLARGGTQLVMAVHDLEDIVPAVGHVLRIGRGGKCIKSVFPPRTG